jgi:predicted 3-demethylubiquinone-9 3-methyltransferase (glyoxalase superfamily)
MLWFDSQALEAAEFYTSLLPNSEVDHIEYYAESVPGGEAGAVMTVDFVLDGSRFTALNGGPHHMFNDSVSFVIPCADQGEIDRLWAAMTSDGGQEVQCGWLKDKFGVSWQIVPENISDLLSTDAAVQAMLQMKKLDIAALEAAGAGDVGSIG